TATLRRIGLRVRSRVYRHASAPAVVLALATRRPEGFTTEQAAILDEAAPLLELHLARCGASLAFENEKRNRQMLEARLVEIERQSTIGTVASAVAHDLAAPISALLMEVGEMRERVQYLGSLIGDNSPILRNVLEDVRGLVDHCTDSTERARQLL